jgi:molybdopterin-guanine dinucleotide biosynthesis protein A
MGTDKALLAYSNTTLLHHVLSILAEITPQIVVVAEQGGQYTVPCGKVIGDTYPGEGPLGGIITGLKEMGEGWHIIVACDMPLLQPALLRFMITQAQEPYHVVVPEQEGLLEPLCALYHSTALPLLQSAFDEGERAVHRALRRLNLHTLPRAALTAYDPHLQSLHNINTPQEWSTISPNTERG